ncbi:winged helix-turn-helix domain-containing protein [Pseudoalteromonas spongiae]|uniref:winged helix-turn-helix domain-containing protein n=1 Tax=Pseudoalteromonas spongiae TaxID=298657 RepID=UPI000C2D213F|nr:winged helix-turn-helix domain-containing protein [Pseudoalteromonas spongiae]
MHDSQQYSYQTFQFDFSRCEVVTTSGISELEPKVMAVLELLYHNQGKVISSEDIFNQVWPGRVFNASLIQRAIALIRKALNEQAATANYLVTYPKKGYCLKEEAAKFSGNRIKLFLLAISVLVFFVVGVVAHVYKKQHLVPMHFTSLSPLTHKQQNAFAFSQNRNANEMLFVKEGDLGSALWLKSGVNESEIFNTPQKIAHTFWFKGQPAFTTRNNHQGTDVFVLNHLGQANQLFSVEYLMNVAPKSVGQRIYIAHLNQITVFDDKAAKLHAFSAFENAKGVISFSVSQDLEKVAVLTDEGQMRKAVSIINVKTKNKELIFQDVGNYTSLDWHASGLQLLLAKNTQLMLLDVERGKTEVLPYATNKTITQAQFDKHGDAILIEHTHLNVVLALKSVNENPTTFKRIDLAGANLMPISNSSGDILFSSDFSGEQALYRSRNNELTVLAELNKGQHLNGFTWLSDNAFIYSLGKQLVINDGNSVKQIHSLSHSVFIRQFLPQQNTLLVHQLINGKTYPSTLSLDSFEVTQLGNEQASCVTGDDNGNIYFVENNNTIKQRNKKGQVNTLLTISDNTVDDLLSDGEDLFASIKKAEGSIVIRINPRTAEFETILVDENAILAGVEKQGKFWFYQDIAVKSSLMRLY